MRRSAWPSGRVVVIALSLLGVLPHLLWGVGAADVVRGDRAFARRAQGASEVRAAPGPIGEAVAAYRAAVVRSPWDFGIRVKLLRALFFQGEYAAPDPKAKKAAFEEGRRVFSAGLELLEQRTGQKRLDRVKPERLPGLIGSIEQIGAFYFMGALHWGLWGENFGTMASVRKGVAKKIRNLGEAAIVLDPEYESGGAYRLVGRLHAVAPRIPIFTGWVNRNHAIAMLEKAYSTDPSDPLNKVFLAEALIEFRPGQKRRALDLLTLAADSSPRPGLLIEDTSAIAEAREALERVLKD